MRKTNATDALKMASSCTADQKGETTVASDVR